MPYIRVVPAKRGRTPRVIAKWFSTTSGNSRNFSGRDSCPDPHPDWGGVDSNHIIEALGAWLDHLESGPAPGMGKGMYP